MTQTEKARKGILSPALKKAAAAEGLAPETLAERVARGLAVIPFNPVHAPAPPAAIGQGLRTKVNVNLGTSRDFPRLADELRKVRISLVGVDVDDHRTVPFMLAFFWPPAPGSARYFLSSRLKRYRIYASLHQTRFRLLWFVQYSTFVST